MIINDRLLIILLTAITSSYCVIYFEVYEERVKGLTCIEPLYRHVVVIAEKVNGRYKYHGLGTVLNHKWIVTLELVVSTVSNPNNIIAVAGNNDKVENLKHIPIASIRRYNSIPRARTYLYNEEAIFPKTLALLEVKGSIKFGTDIGEIIFAFEHSRRNFLHCEVVSLVLENNMISKTHIPVKLLLPGHKECHTKDEDLACMHPKLQHRNSMKFVNPCYEKANLGSPVTCDIGLEAVFYGDENGGGCNSNSDPTQLRAYYIKRPDDPNSNWIDKVIRPPGPSPDEAVDDDYVIVDTNSAAESGSTSSVSTGRSNDGHSTNAAEENSPTSSIDVGQNGTDYPDIKTENPAGGMKDDDEIDDRKYGMMPPPPTKKKCSSGYRHDQLLYVTLLLASFRYII